LLADSSKEGAEDGTITAGLGLISGEVHSLKSLGCSSRVPHMGWNSIRSTRSANLLKGIPDETDFYFVHSYAFLPERQEDVVAVTDYDVPVPAIVGQGHVWGTQFHPEKSSRAGFTILQNFINDPIC